MAEKIREHGPYDWAFIDGDHTEHGVRTDYATVLSAMAPDGLIALHDVTPPGGNNSTPPNDLLRELEQAGCTVTRYEDDVRDPWTHGIGIVHL